MLSCRVAVDDSVSWDILCNDGTSANECVLANHISTDYGGISTNAGTTFDERGEIVFTLIAGEGGTRCGDIRKHHGRPAEDIIF